MRRIHLALFAVPVLAATLACSALTSLAATPTPVPTFTLAPTFTPEPTITPQSSVLFEDSEFVRSCDTESTPEVDRFVENGAFNMRVIPSSYVGWSECTQVEFTDFVMEADATQLEGPDNNAYGLIFRYGLDSSDFYVFAISGDGFYALYIDGGDRESPQMIVDWTETSAVIQGNATNQLKVVAAGDTFSLYVNGESLGQASDSTLPSGTVGFFAAAADEGNVRISFDNLKVSRP